MPAVHHPAEILHHSMSDSTPSCGGTLVSTDGRALPLRSARLMGRLFAGLGRVRLEQTFENPYEEPLRVTYQLPLPEDGAVSGFSFRVGDREIVGEVDRKDRARERFEEAIAEGRTAAHLEQERASLFTQEVGNIPPKTTVVVRIEIDQRLAWIPDADAGAGGWEWRFPTVVAPRYLGATGRVADAARVAVNVADQPRPITMSMAMSVADDLPGGGKFRSPSHGLSFGRDGVVSFADEGVGLDRDIVLRWPVATPKVGLSVDVAKPDAGHAADGSLFGLLTIVPPSQQPDAPVSRDLVVLLDTSGSMGGEPLAQAKRVTCALIDGLTDRDTLELIEFSNRPRRFGSSPKAADRGARKKARQWVESLRAGGGTEMVSGILAALQGVRAEAQRQVVVITDGLIGFERDVVAAILEQLPSGSRLHTVGVGSAVNRSLTGPAARAGRGVEVVIGLGEDPERASRRLLERTQDPIVVDLAIEGSALVEQAPQRLPDLYAGSPALISVKLAAGGGHLRVRGRTASGTWEARVDARAPLGQSNAGVITCFAREKVEDHELARTAGGDREAHDAAITQLGLDYQIATRLTSWIAISEKVDVDPGDPTRREEVPQELPYGMSVEGLGLREASVGGPTTVMHRVAAPQPMASAPMDALSLGGMAPPAPPSGPAGPPSHARGRKKAKGGIVSRLLGRGQSRDEMKTHGYAPEPAPEKPRAAPEQAEAEAEGSSGKHELLDMDDEAFDGRADELEEAPASSSSVTRTGVIRADEAPGVLVSKKGDTWIVEVVAVGDMKWEPGDRVKIRLSDGTTVEATRVAAGSTRAGDVTFGTRMRLVLRLTAPTELPPVTLELTNCGRTFTVAF